MAFEKTLIILKPDAVARRLMGRIISRFEEKGLRIAAMKMANISKSVATKHYAEHKAKSFFPNLLKFITSGPVVLMVIEGNSAISVCRKMMGATFGSNAEPGSIRGDFGISNQYNLVHGSDSPASAKREIALYFKKNEMVKFPADSLNWFYDLGSGKPY